MIRAFQWDLARQVERLDVLLGLLPKYSKWGYQELYLHLEDAVEYPSAPTIARADALSYGDMQQLVNRARDVGIGVVPIVNLLGHTRYLLKTEEFRELSEVHDEAGHPLVSGQICPLHPRTLDVADRLINDMAPFCTAGKLHVGLDESFSLGRCPRCRAEIEQRGLAHHFAAHAGRLHQIVSRRGLRMGLWADMLNFIPEAIPLLPRDVIAYDWYYYPFRKHPRVELYNFAESDLATPLARRGIEYWGCPMNGAFRYEPLPLFADRLENIRSWWKRCERVGAAGMLVTSWEAYRLALETTTVVDAAAASLWLDPTPTSTQAMLAKGFARVSGQRSASTAARVAQTADRYPFAGYARWETNDRWDNTNPLAAASLSQARREARALRRLEHKAKSAPAALRESVSFRSYLAQRDGFVAAAAEGVVKLRQRAGAKPGTLRELLTALQTEASEFERTWREGRRAARAMWRLTRDPKARGQNEDILDRDLARLREWRAWLRQCARDPHRVFSASPVFGAWQLIFTVVNFAPVLQRVSVEARQTDDSWRELAGRHTIEFQAHAAQPRARIRRVFSVSVESREQPLRLVVRGLGEVRIENVELTNGVTRLRAKGLSRFTLGELAPRSGFPDITRRLAEHPLEFRVD